MVQGFGGGWGLCRRPTHTAEPLPPCPGPGALVREPQQPDHASRGAVQPAVTEGECCHKPSSSGVGAGVQPAARG